MDAKLQEAQTIWMYTLQTGVNLSTCIRTFEDITFVLCVLLQMSIKIIYNSQF
jgi:hypothetical protein